MAKHENGRGGAVAGDIPPASNPLPFRLWRRRLTRYVSGPTNVSSIPAAIYLFYFALLAFFVRLGPGLFGGPPADI